MVIYSEETLKIVAFLTVYKLPPTDCCARPLHLPHTSLSVIHTKQASIEHSARGDQTPGHCNSHFSWKKSRRAGKQTRI